MVKGMNWDRVNRDNKARTHGTTPDYDSLLTYDEAARLDRSSDGKRRRLIKTTIAKTPVSRTEGRLMAISSVLKLTQKPKWELGTPEYRANVIRQLTATVDKLLKISPQRRQDTQVSAALALIEKQTGTPTSRSRPFAFALWTASTGACFAFYAPLASAP